MGEGAIEIDHRSIKLSCLAIGMGHTVGTSVVIMILWPRALIFNGINGKVAQFAFGI